MVELPVFVETDRSWMDRAACKGMPIGLFYVEKKGPGPLIGKETCGQCPVSIECAIYALEHSIKDGLWGGMNVRERRKVGLAELLRRKDVRDES